MLFMHPVCQNALAAPAEDGYIVGICCDPEPVRDYLHMGGFFFNFFFPSFSFPSLLSFLFFAGNRGVNDRRLGGGVFCFSSDRAQGITQNTNFIQKFLETDCGFAENLSTLKAKPTSWGAIGCVSGCVSKETTHGHV
jgi:hypothetical protein